MTIYHAISGTDIVLCRLIYFLEELYYGSC